MLNVQQHRLLDLPDLSLISLIEGPLLDPLPSQETCLRQDLQVFAGRWMTDAEFSRNQQAADTVLNQVAVDLRGKVAPRIFQPLQDLQPAVVCEGSKNAFHLYLLSSQNGI